MDSPERPQDADEEELRALARLLDVTGKSAASGAGSRSTPTPRRPTAPVRAAPPRSGPAPAPAAPVTPGTTAREGNGMLPGTLVAQRFEVVSLLGAGPHGAVWRARDHSNQGRELALKILRSDRVHSPKFLERARDLQDRLRLIGDSKVNRLRGLGRLEDGRVWLAWDLVQGENLRGILDHRGALPPRRALEIIRQVLQGLERGHGNGVLHGAVNPENVFLTDRVPWSEENPFAVGVELLDFGFAPLLGPERENQSPSADLLATAVLLAELLTGTRLASDWIGSAATVATAALSPATRRMLDTALDPRPEARFQTAAEFRQALERTPDWRGARRVPRRWIVTGSIVVAIALVTGFLWLRELQAGNDIVQAQTSAPAAPPPAPAPLTEELEQRVADAEAERAQLADENAQLSRRLTEELATVREAEEDWHMRASAAEAERARLEQENAGLTARLDEEVAGLQGDLELTRAASTTATVRIAELRRESEELARRAAEATAERDRALAEGEELAGRVEELEAGAAEISPRRTAAAHLDLLLARLDTDDVAGAASASAALRAEAPELTPEGRSFLAAWITAEGHRAGQAGVSDVAAQRAGLDRTEQALGQARKLFAAFLAGSGSWLELPLEEETTRRAERIAAALDGIEETCAGARRELAEGIAARWEEILATPDRDPEAILPLTGTEPEGRLGEFLLRYVGFIEARAVKNGGRLDVSVLESVASLPAWADHVRSEPRLTDDEAGLDILLFDLARSLGDGDERLAPDPVPTSWRALLSGRDWRSQVVLKAQLLAQDSAFPGQASVSLLHARTPDGEESWIWEEVLRDAEPSTDCDASWSVRQRFYDARGVALGERTLSIQRHAALFVEVSRAQRESLDLGDPDAEFEVREWSPGPLPTIPDGLPVRPDEVAAFRSRLRKRSHFALVGNDGARRTWFSPELGLVRHADPRRITHELAYRRLR